MRAVALLLLLTISSVESRNVKKVLITGASGYLGQFLMDELSKYDFFEVAGTFNSREDSCSVPKAPCFPMDISEGMSVMKVVGRFRPDVVVNLAALSSIYESEKNWTRTRAINAPDHLLHAIKLINPSTVFIQLSTDQVYSGEEEIYQEDSPTRPVNAYGRSKLLFETSVKSLMTNYYILRSSAIYGPEPPRKCGKSSLVQFLSDAIKCKNEEDQPVALFHDEIRCPIYVNDLVQLILTLIITSPKMSPADRIMNVGGHNCISRAEFGALIATMKGCSPAKYIKASTREETEKEGGVKAPKKVIIRSKRAEELLGGWKIADLEGLLPKLMGNHYNAAAHAKEEL